MNKKILLIFILLLLIPARVYAVAGTTNLKCYKGEGNNRVELTTESNKVLPGETISCDLEGSIEGGTLKKYHGRVVLGENLTLVSITPSSTWITAEPNTQAMNYEANENITGNYSIATIMATVNTTITNGADTSVSIADQEYSQTAEPDSFISLSPELKNIRIASINNYLSGLSLSQGTLNEEFNKNTTRYTATVAEDVSTITVSATPEASSSNVTGAGEKALNYGTNEVTITVTSESGTPKTYTLLITRTDNRSTASNLLDFEFYNYDIKFNKDTTSYTLKVDNNITKLGLCNAKPTTTDTLCINNNKSFSVDDKAEISEAKLNNVDILEKIENGNNVVLGDLKAGENILNLVIKAENESSKSYRISITRGSAATDAKTTGATDKGTIENPETGSAFILIILAILIASISCVLYFYKKNQKTDTEQK